jgi:hypothetical protein
MILPMLTTAALRFTPLAQILRPSRRLDCVPVPFFYTPMGEDLPFRVELWDRGWRRLETLATASDFVTAKAAFVAAVKRRPREPILLCDRARIVMRSGEGRDG